MGGIYGRYATIWSSERRWSSLFGFCRKHCWSLEETNVRRTQQVDPGSKKSEVKIAITPTWASCGIQAIAAHPISIEDPCLADEIEFSACVHFAKPHSKEMRVTRSFLLCSLPRNWNSSHMPSRSSSAWVVQEESFMIGRTVWSVQLWWCRWPSRNRFFEATVARTNLESAGAIGDSNTICRSPAPESPH